MKSYQFTCCRRVDGKLEILDIVTPPTVASSRTEALTKLNQFFMDNDCRPYKEVR